MLDSDSAVRGLAVLTAIPVVMFALWAEYFGRYIEAIVKEKPRFDRTLEILRARVASALVLLFQATLFLGTADVRGEYPVGAPIIFMIAVVVQLAFHAALLRKIRNIGSEQVTSEMLRPGRPKNAGPAARLGARPELVALLRPKSHDNAAVNAAEGEAPAPGDSDSEPRQIPGTYSPDADPFAIGARAVRSLLWFGAGAALYLLMLIGTVRLAAWIATALHLGTAAGSALIITGAIVGIAAGLGFNFALGPMHLKKMLPVKPVTDPELRARLEGHFQNSGVRVPELWIIEGDQTRQANAMIAGFKWGRGIFRPGLFLSQNLLDILSPSELDAVIRHEVSHVMLAHLRQRMILSAGLILASTCAGTFFIMLLHHLLDVDHFSNLIAPGIAVAAFLVTMKLLGDQSKLQEIEADIHTIDVLGSTMQDLSSALVKLDKHNDASSGRSTTPTLLSGKAHPTTESRIRVMSAYLAAKAKRANALNAARTKRENSDSDQNRAA